jgi:ABC-type antimicrobial peptide transport system permease subunit
MPLTTVQELWFGVTMENGIDQGPTLKLNRIIVQMKDTDRFDETIEQMRNILSQTHRGIQDFGFNTREDWADMIESGVRGVRVSGALIVVVTLIAGGVGITNIMLASIKERTREIGIRRAVGATPAGIFLQITLEAVVLSIVAGILGLGMGYGLVELLKKVASGEQPPILEFSAVFYSFAAAVLTGIFSGFLPAWKASQLHPIEALRFE